MLVPITTSGMFALLALILVRQGQVRLPRAGPGLIGWLVFPAAATSWDWSQLRTLELLPAARF